MCAILSQISITLKSTKKLTWYAFSDLQTEVDTGNVNLAKARTDLKEAQDLIDQLANQIQELQFTNQLLKDEHQASVLAWNSKEKELLEVQKENGTLVKQIMEFKVTQPFNH